jgi:hypothetical protein
MFRGGILLTQIQNKSVHTSQTKEWNSLSIESTVVLRLLKSNNTEPITTYCVLHSDYKKELVKY